MTIKELKTILTAAEFVYGEDHDINMLVYYANSYGETTFEEYEIACVGFDPSMPVIENYVC